jgi:NitT/TauT family transport system substrate-binding protein
MRFERRRILTMVTSLLVLVLVAAPSVLVDVATADTKIAQATGTPVEVTVRFTWKLKGEYAPLYVAQEKGYYSAAGLNVKLAEGSGAKTALRQLAAGQEQVVWGPVVNAAQSVAAGIPVKVIAVYQPKVPIGLIAHPDTPLRGPKDLEGKKLGYTIGETVADLLDPFLRLHKIDKSKLTLIQMDGGARVTQFMSRRIDLISVFTNNDLPELEKKAGVKFNVLRFADFGLSVLGAGFMTSDQQLKERADVLRRLIQATNKGFEDARRSPEEAAGIMLKAFKVPVERDVLVQQVRATVEAATAPAGRPLGWQSEELWKSTLDLLVESGSIKEKRPLAEYYTNTLLE